MQGLTKNYKKEDEQPLWPLCEIEDDTIEHVLKWWTERNIKNNTEEEWEEEVQIFSKKIKENKKKGGKKFKNQFFLIGILSMQG